MNKKPLEAGQHQITALLFAATTGNLSAVQYALEAGVGVNDGDYDKRTALHLASAEGHLEICQYLIDKGADVNVEDRFGLTPLDDAIRGDHSSVTQYLLACGSRKPSDQYSNELLNACSSGDLSCVSRLLKNGVSSNSVQYDGRSALHIAAAEYQVPIVKLLLSYGADMETKDRWGGTPLDDALRHKNRVGDNELITLLKQKSAEKNETLKWYHDPYVLIFVALEALILIIYGLYTQFDPSANHMNRFSDFLNMEIMLFIGFGYLFTFLRKYGYSSVSITFFSGGIVMQLTPLLMQFFHSILFGKWEIINLNMFHMINALYCVGVVLVTFGVVIGTVSPRQMLLISVVETVFYCLNVQLCEKLLMLDLGGSVLLHLFGAVFGVAYSLVATPPEAKGPSTDNAPVYHSDLFGMIGTIFLWIYWPSFNAILTDGLLYNIIVMNTLFSLIGSLVASFCSSYILREEQKFHMVDIQNCTLAGGVGIVLNHKLAIGTISGFTTSPILAFAIGLSSAFVCNLGFTHIQPYVQRYTRLHDTFPGMIGGVWGILGAAITSNTALLSRSNGEQALYQLLMIFLTVAISSVSGALTGLFFRSYNNVKNYFIDTENFSVPGMENPYYFDIRGENQHSADVLEESKKFQKSASCTESEMSTETRIEPFQSKVTQRKETSKRLDAVSKDDLAAKLDLILSKLESKPANPFEDRSTPREPKSREERELSGFIPFQ